MGGAARRVAVLSAGTVECGAVLVERREVWSCDGYAKHGRVRAVQWWSLAECRNGWVPRSAVEMGSVLVLQIEATYTKMNGTK